MSAGNLNIKENKIKVAEIIVQKHGAMGVFIARLLPVVRHLISMPAGIFRMKFSIFSIVTLTGAGFWCYILSVWGEKVIGKHPELLNSPKEMMHAVRSEMIWFILAVGGLAALYLVVIWFKRRLS